MIAPGGTGAGAAYGGNVGVLLGVPAKERKYRLMPTTRVNEIEASKIVLFSDLCPFMPHYPPGFLTNAGL